MTMATVAYKRRLFPVQILKARPMARSRVATVTAKFVEIAETERNFGNFSIVSDFFWDFLPMFPPWRCIAEMIRTTKQEQRRLTKRETQSILIVTCSGFGRTNPASIP